MSVLSQQIDNLRLMARLVREYDYSEISRMLREAADTIEGLRERLQGECEVKYHNVYHDGDTDEWTCLSCGERWMQEADWPAACPYCGKAVS